MALAPALAFGHVFWLEPHFFSPTAHTPDTEAVRLALPGGMNGSPNPGALTTPFIIPGIKQPPARPAQKAQLPADALIVGISAGGKHRAYLIQAFKGPGHHIVNDLLGDQPISIAHCDRTGCTRVFTGEERSVPLALDLGGIVNDKMLLLVQGIFYDQESTQPATPELAPFPYSVLPPDQQQQTTWGAWKELHPDTDVYVGDRASSVGSD